MHRLDKDSTIYNFTLVKKVRHRPLPLLLYGLLLLPAAVLWAASTSVYVLASFAGGLLLLPLLYSALAALYTRLLVPDQRSPWSYGWRFPWLGLLPEQHVPLRIVILIHHQLLWIGCAVVCCLYPWIGEAHWSALLALHIWYLLPRYWIFFMLRHVKKPGLLKINAADTSYYVQ
ncbi:hypothetical protein [Paenibacillus sp. GYB003]|uniref:hypothetical protein n=1 Tax=Paenibacillus sp. GYB003 TaxID=2994392 RepID=UPI002F9674DE